MKTNSNQAPEFGDGQYAVFDVAALLSVLRQRRWVILSCMAAGLLLGVAYAATRADLYEASASVRVEEGNPAVVAIENVTKEDFRQPETLKTVEQQLSTRNLIWRVIQSNKLDEKPGFFRPGFMQRLQGRPISRGDMIDALAGGFTVKLRRGTRLVDITARHGDPRMAESLVNSLLGEYSAQDAEWKATRFREANKFLMDEAERLKRKAEASERALQEYREKNQAVSLDEKQNIIVERLKDLNLRAAKTQAERVSLETDLAQIDGIGRQPGKLLGIGTIANAQSVLDVRRLANEKEVAFAMLKQRYGAENPAYAQAEREWKQVKAALDATVLNAADALRASYDAARSRHETSEKMLSEQEEAALDLNRKAIEYNRLNREVESDRALFEPVLKRLKESSVIENISQIHLRVIEPPMLAESPLGNKKLLLAALGLLAGVAVGVGGVVARHMLRPTIQTEDDAGRVLGLPMLGAIPNVPGLRMDERRLPGLSNPQSQAAEAFRFETASEALVNKGSVLFTSSAGEQGNTFCAASHAIALARSGARTLLVDANVRSPAVGRIFSIPAGSSGLVECLTGGIALDAAILPTHVENLSVLVAGAAAPDIAALFSCPAAGALIEGAASKYDYVVIDSAPVTMASETLVFAKHAQTVCIVVEAGRTTVASASRACRLLEGAGRPPVGFILNRVLRTNVP